MKPKSESKTLYDILDVNPDASLDDIKKAYRQKMSGFQMGRGSPIHKDKLIHAFAILSDPERRAAYDEKGFTDRSSLLESNSLNQILLNIFSEPQRAPDIIENVHLTLEQIYSGCNHSVVVIRNRVCKQCDGLGARHDGIVRCSNCVGRGWLFVGDFDSANQPNMEALIVQKQCETCDGQGEVVVKPCTRCQGKKTVKSSKRYNLKISPGIHDGHHVEFPSEGHELPGLKSGNLIIVIHQSTHDQFIRCGNDVYVNVQLTLTEALCGFKKYLKTLDGKYITISSKQGTVYKPGTKRCVKGKGMPWHYKGNYYYGCLIISFFCTFPEKMEDNKITKRIETILNNEINCKENDKDDENLNQIEIVNENNLIAVEMKSVKAKMKNVEEKNKEKKTTITNEMNNLLIDYDNYDLSSEE